MPYRYSIDTGRGVVFSVAWGHVTGDELLAGIIATKNDPLFQADMRVFADFTPATSVDAPTARLIEIAKVTPFSSGSRRAYLVRKDLIYGLVRMYAAHAETLEKGEIGVFRDRTEALAWLNRGVTEERWVRPDDALKPAAPTPPSTPAKHPIPAKCAGT